MKILELFSKKTLTLADLQVQRETLAADLERAEPTATASRDRCSDVAAGLAPGSLDAAEAEARQAEDRVASLRAALLKINVAIAAETKRIDDAARAEQRAQAHKLANELADELAAIYERVVPELERGLELTKRADYTLGMFMSTALQFNVGSFQSAASLMRDASLSEEMVERALRVCK